MENTNLNVAPYYDDFAEDKNFHRVLFRPGFSVQARELTALQTILQNQVERHGRHMFKEGTVVIPGSTGFTTEYYAVKLEGLLESTEVSGYIQDFVGKRITGAASGVVAEVIQATAATSADPITLFVKYVATGTNNVTTVFNDGEKISANGTVGSFGSGVASAQLQALSATATGSSANIQEGVYFVRGHFVKVATQRIILDKYTNTPNYRIGLTVTETLETPEEDVSLLDNAQGSSNVNAKGAHRLKITLTLAKLALDSVLDGDFIELLRTNTGIVQQKARNTEYSVLGETLARRTFDESGDYSVSPFQIDIRETSNDGLNNGIYDPLATTDDQNSASDDFLTIQVAPGKAYVRGYEVETISPRYIDVPKPRSFENYNAAVTPVEVGNFVRVTNAFSSPEISPFISGDLSEPYRQIGLFDTKTSSAGSSSGAQIGIARARSFEHFSGTANSQSEFGTDAVYNLYLFDIRMFTKITLSGTPSAIPVAGDKITGVSTGAYGFVVAHEVDGTTDVTAAAVVTIASVTGIFTVGEKVTCSSSAETDEILENSSNADLTLSAVSSFDFSRVKQAYMPSTDSGTDPHFTSDIVLEASTTIAGLNTILTGDKDAVTGFQTDYGTELEVGDIISIPSGTSGALEERRVDAISGQTLDLSADVSGAISSVAFVRKRASLRDQNKNILLRKLQKNSIKTLKTTLNNGVSDTSVVIRRTFVGQSNSGGDLSFSAGANETFNAVSNTDYVLTVLVAGTGGTAVAGDKIDLTNAHITFTGAGTGSIVIGDSTDSPFGNGATVRLITTITRTTVQEKSKTRTRMYQVLVHNAGIGGTAKYGVSAHQPDISLGVSDIHKLWAVFDSEGASTDPVLPQWTVTGSTGNFTQGELITGTTSGAKARVVNTISPVTFIPINNTDFETGETITGAESAETGSLDTFTAGSRIITNDFVLDNGQRDNFYDIGRIVRKPNTVAPVGRLMIVADYFTHGTGDFFNVDSYSAISYKDIPTYSATRVDPEVADPTGEYDLRDTVDFRPRVADATTTTQTIQTQTVYRVTSYSFNMESRSFAGSGSSTVSIPKDNSNFIYDLDFHVGRKDSLFIAADGKFKVVRGADSEVPQTPKPIDDAMKLADLDLPPFVIDVNDVTYTSVNNRRYTMRDIGKLEARIENIEYYTALNLLEKDANTLQIQDADGFDRFKSGFLVDNFKGHATGDVQHADYRNSIDMQHGELRPKYFMKGVTLSEENTTASDRSNDQYAKTGDIITLPYTHKVAVEQPYATRIENLNPVLSFAWAGICRLSPSGDEWFETARIPDLIVNREGNFDTVLAQNANALGTIWNAWQTQWSGVTTSTSNEWRSSGRRVLRRTVTNERGTLSRRGVTTTVVAQIDTESQGDRVVSRALIPFIRARNITFTVTGLKPLTKVYPFFDKSNVAALVTPSGGSAGGNLVSSASGKVEGTFAIPNPNVQGNSRFRTGDRLFRLTSSTVNALSPEPETFAQAIYSATGILSTIQETIVATRNARVEVRNPSQQETTSRQISDRTAQVGWYDPLAQSFMPVASGGEYITKIDTFFQGKDSTLPVTIQIREMSNGYPTNKVLPFATKSLEPSEVSISEDASVATTVTFDEPVYVKDGVEYCIVMFTDSQNYLTWISRMGETDVGGSRLVSDQPYLGVLFKSQNNSTWTAYDLEDLKFTIYRATFDISKTAAVTLVNDVLPVKTLKENPIRTFASTSKIKVSHNDHHMYTTTNNVTIAGVSSGVNTTLNSSLAAGATSLSLASDTGFPNSGTVFVKIGSEITSGTISGTTISSLTRAVEGTDVLHADASVVELYELSGIPLTQINKTHVALGDIQMDSYTLSTTASADGSITGGGKTVTATENALIDTMQTLVPVIEHPNTTISAKSRTTTGTSPSGAQQSFVKQTLSQADQIPITDNYYFEVPKIICSQINETSELSGNKSFELIFTMTSSAENLSPIIDLDRKTLVTVANRLDNIDTSADVFPVAEFNSPTEPEGDSGEVVYITRKAQLKTPATSLKCFVDAVKFDSAEIQLMYKVLRSDDSSDFNEIGWTYFNTTGAPDSNVNSSVDFDDFIEREYSVNNLPQFISFAIKIRMQGTNCAEPPRIKDLRAIALAT